MCGIVSKLYSGFSEEWLLVFGVLCTVLGGLRIKSVKKPLVFISQFCCKQWLKNQQLFNP